MVHLPKDNKVSKKKLNEILCEDNTILWISKFCLCVYVRWCFIE